MQRKYLILVIMGIITTIIISIFAFPILLNDVFLNNCEESQGKIPEVLIIADPSSGNAPLKVSFKSLLQHFGDDVKYSWDFGDGKSSNEKIPNHIYFIDGNYCCSLTVYDGGSEFSDDVIITVFENNPPIIKIIVDKTSGNRPLTVNFDVDGFDIDGEIASYEWEIVYPPFFSSQKVVNREERNFSEKLLRTGFYEVKLTVEDDNGKIATDYIKIQVLGHRIELLIGTSLYCLGILDTIQQIFNKIIEKITIATPQTFAEKLISFWR